MVDTYIKRNSSLIESLKALFVFSESISEVCGGKDIVESLLIENTPSGEIFAKIAEVLTGHSIREEEKELSRLIKPRDYLIDYEVNNSLRFKITASGNFSEWMVQVEEKNVSSDSVLLGSAVSNGWEIWISGHRIIPVNEDRFDLPGLAVIFRCADSYQKNWYVSPHLRSPHPFYADSLAEVVQIFFGQEEEKKVPREVFEPQSPKWNKYIIDGAGPVPWGDVTPWMSGVDISVKVDGNTTYCVVEGPGDAAILFVRFSGVVKTSSASTGEVKICLASSGSWSGGDNYKGFVLGKEGARIILDRTGSRQFWHVKNGKWEKTDPIVQSKKF